MIECSPSPTESGLYVQILDRLYEDIPNSSADQKRNHVVEIARKIKLRVLVIDELHNFATSSDRAKHTFLNTLKFLMNELKISIIGCGTKELIQGLAINTQVQNRFQIEALPRWRLNSDYQRLLASVETTLPLRKESKLHSKELAKRIFALSEGTIGETIMLINKAGEHAITTQTECITLESLGECGFIPPSKRKAAISAL